MRPFLCEPYLLRLRRETAEAADAANAASQVAHLWALGLLDARFDTLLLPVLLPASRDPLEYLVERGLPPDFARQRLECGGCLILTDGVDPALERRYSKCIFVSDANRLLQSGSTCP